MVNKTWTMTEEGLAEQDYFVKSDKYSIDSLEQKTDTRQNPETGSR